MLCGISYYYPPCNLQPTMEAIMETLGAITVLILLEVWWIVRA